eukprot:Pgem_evm1s3962
MHTYIKGHNVKVNVICPGYVVSGMTEAAKAKGRKLIMCLETKDACERIRKGLFRNDCIICFPFSIYLLLWAFQSLPIPLQDFARVIVGEHVESLTAI